MKQERDKLRAITYRNLGKTALWIAAKLDRSPGWVYKHWNKTEDQIKTRPRSGRPRMLSARARRVIRRNSNRIGQSNRVIRDKLKSIQQTSHQSVGRERQRMGIKAIKRPRAPPLTEHKESQRCFGRGYGQGQTDWIKRWLLMNPIQHHSDHAQIALDR